MGERRDYAYPAQVDTSRTRSGQRPVPAAPPEPPQEVDFSAEAHPGRPDERAPGRREDRWAWRRRLKADPTTRVIYRGAVGVVGTTLMIVALMTGWLPGPGGIPLFLIGLAVLASEFEWAHHLLERAKLAFHELTEWSARQPVWVRWSSGLLAVLLVTAAAWGALAVLSVPGWFPDVAADLLDRLPGVDDAG